MAQIRETIEAFCTVLNDRCSDKVSAESFRQAKFNKDETTATLWRTLRTILCTQSIEPIDKSNHDFVKLCKHKMFRKGYRICDFYRLPEDMTRGSRELMLALGWLMAKENVVTLFLNGLQPLIFEDPPIDFALYHKIPLPATLDDCAPSKQKECDLQNPVHVAERLILKYNKLHATLRSLLESRNEYTKAICKLHSIRKASKSQSLSHFSSQDIYFLRHPQKLSKYQERLEWFCNYARALVFWSLNELTYWKWMESVLDAKILNTIKTDSEIGNTDGCQQNQPFKPSWTLQKAKEYQVELCQVLKAEETVCRTVLKSWKKIKANLQESSQERNDNPSDHLSLLDQELLVEIRELQGDFKSSYEHLKYSKPKKVSFCLRKLNHVQSRTEAASKEISNMSAAAEEILRLTKEKQALEGQLRNLQKQHRAKLYKISQTSPNLVCISSD